MDILMPQLGETVSEGTVGRWYKAVGDAVASGEPLFEIETDKASMDVEATAAGVLTQINVQAGETVAVGVPVAILETKGSGGGAVHASNPAPAANALNGGHAGAPPPGFGPYSEVATPTGRFGTAKGPNGLRVTPLARRLIAQNGIDLDALAAEVSSAGRPRIAKADVLQFVGGTPQGASTQEARPSPPAAGMRSVPLNRIRRTTATHLAKSWTTVPHVVQAIEVDFHRVDSARRAYNSGQSGAEQGGRGGARLSFLPFIARAVCQAIRDFPFVNAQFDGDRLLVHDRVNLGIAMDLSHDGLVVPVIRGADELTVVGLARAIAERIERARAGKLTQDEMAGGTYSISNSGTFGTLFTAPIVNPPEVAILSTDGVTKKPVAIETEAGDAIVVRPIGVLAQSFDHRAFDGAYSAAFLKRLKGILEETDWLQGMR